MKRILTYLTSLLLMGTLAACHEEQNELFATAVISLTTDQSLTLGQVQAQAQLTNVNTRQVTSSANFDGPVLHVELLRGAYQVSIEGVVTCQDAAGATSIHQFRAQSDYVELEKTGSNATSLNIIFLD
ncbi:MAG: hypothetical protein IJV38_04100 [Prevotella sp.]|nr:hypothetical protein [Prevotella sp.]